jgi:glycosyltransferase involved in cell wall biosynthesis
VVENAIDVQQLKNDLRDLNKDWAEELRNNLNISSNNIGVFCGSIYKEKKVDFLIAASLLVREKISSFNLVVIGEGPTSSAVEVASKKYSWVHYVGPKYGSEKVRYLRLGNVLLIPDAIGLVVLDSFTMSIPIITTIGSFHGPEVDYLNSGENSLVTASSIEAYALNIITFMTDSDLREKLSDGCKKSASRYTLENMVNNFSSGVKKALVAQE